MTRALPCANPESSLIGLPERGEAASPTERPRAGGLTPCDGPLNALAYRSQHCASAIPDRRVAAAIRSRQEPRWCSASCRVKGCVAKKRGGG
jgi:hypothetical protein